MSRRAPLRGDELPEIVVPPPGPKSRAAAKRVRRAEGAAIWGSGEPPLVWARARGSVVEDLDGNRYVDLTSGFGAASLGHAAPEIARAVAAQARRMVQGLGDLHPHVQREKLVRRLSSLGGACSGVLLATTGSEAVELALKTAALVTGRRRIVAFEGGYHGQSGAAIEATHAPASPPLTLPGGPPRAIHIPFPNSGCATETGPCGPGGCDLSCFEQGWARVERACEGPDPPGAVIVEPIQGRAGVVVPPPEFLPRLCARARARGLLVIYDEIMTGAGRTGPFWAWEHSGPDAEPDMVTAGKGLGGGVAIAALLGKPKVMDVWAGHRSESGESPYASTYYAHPVACAGALAALRVLTTESAAARPAMTFADGLRRHFRDSKCDATVRGVGSMVAIALESSASTATAPAARAAASLAGRGILVLPGGIRGNVLSLLPSRRITGEQADHAQRQIAEALRQP
jgi:4-aminobutyrate aminotransferase-like enzyme